MSEAHSVLDATLGPPEAMVCVTMIDGTRVYGRGVNVETAGANVRCADRTVAIPRERIQYIEVLEP